MCFGGKQTLEGVEAELEKGGAVRRRVAHNLLDDLDGGFHVAGSHPRDSERWDMCYGEGGEKAEDREASVIRAGSSVR